MKSNTFAANLVADQAKQARKENVTTTTNGAKAFKSTLNANVDLHAKLGSARQLSEAAIISTFDAALKEDSDIALRNMLMLRDVRGGMGERNAFRICLKHLYDTNYNVLINSNLLSKVPEVGRWDDLLVFFDKAYNKEIKQKITAIIKQGMLKCIRANELLPRIDTMSEEEAQQILATIANEDTQQVLTTMS